MIVALYLTFHKSSAFQSLFCPNLNSTAAPRTKSDGRDSVGKSLPEV